LKGVQICQALFVGRARAIVVRRHLEHRLNVGLRLERNIRRYPLRSDQLELGSLRQFLVIEIWRVVEHLLEPKQMTGARHHGVERALGLQYTGKLALVKGSKEFSHHIEGAIGHGDILHVGHKIGRIAALGGQAYHFFAQVEPVSVHARHRAHGTRVIALAAANIEQRHGAARRRSTPRHLLAHQLNHRIAQRRVVSTVQKITTTARLRLGIAHGVAALGRAQQI